MTITSSKREERNCRCGCDQEFPIFSGLMSYGTDHMVAFRAAQLFHVEAGPHLWLVLGSGPWFQDDPRGCWVVLHSWVADENIITRIEDPSTSPFSDEDVFGERLLTRAEVLGKNGGAEWAIERRQEFASDHKETAEFLLRAQRASQDP